MSYQTIAEIFLDRTDTVHRSLPCILYKSGSKEPYRTITNGDFRSLVERFAQGLRSLGIKRGDRIALISESRPEWLVTDYACIVIGAVSVPMYPTLTPKHIEHILQHSGAQAVVVSNDVQLSKVIKCIGACPDLRHIIVMNESWTDQKAVIPVIGFRDVSSRTFNGFDIETECNALRTDDLLTIIYTSGTTGIPKGVMLTHKNLIANIDNALAQLPPIGETDTILSFLPLSHGLERMALYLLFRCGTVIAFAESIDTIAENMLEVKPTVMTGVPRFFEKVYAKTRQAREAMPTVKRRLYDWACRIGTDCAVLLEGGKPKRSSLVLRPIADMLVLRKVRAKTGGRIRFFVSGGAALPAEVGRAFAAFGLVILEGYGLTETSPVISLTPTTLIKWGSVGKPLPNVEVCIADNGEILTRSDSVMRGYFKEPSMTAEIIDREGWLHTGDVGEIDSDGYLRITDRIKHLIINENGKNIAPGPIEQLLMQSQYIDQAILLGDKRPYNIALIVPQFDLIRSSLPHLAQQTDTELASNHEVNSLIADELTILQKDLASYERARRFALIAEPFTIENGLLTPTMKIKRKEVEARYDMVIEPLYSSLQ
jgi:long-chain acyl-CoA synthetase